VSWDSLRNVNYGSRDKKIKKERNVEKKLTLTPFSGFRIEVVGIEPVGFFQSLEVLPDVVHFVPVDRLTCHVAQIGEFEMEGAEFGQDAGSAARPTEILARLERYKGR
jgi:hypothetical protein